MRQIWLAALFSFGPVNNDILWSCEKIRLKQLTVSISLHFYTILNSHSSAVTATVQKHAHLCAETLLKIKAAFDVIFTRKAIPYITLQFRNASDMGSSIKSRRKARYIRIYKA